MSVPDGVQSIVEALGSALAAEFGGPAFPANGYTFTQTLPRHFMRYVPVAEFARDDTTVCFIVTPTDPGERTYKRTRSYDIVYFSEDVPDDDQHIIYARDRAMIDAFCAWLARWDAAREGA
ncbi:MAG: hypothetical protein H6698_08395 [Myxococcales bacterium]|nr:hypothetical protein [Myxococcales bacterium]MCB9520146.1 hypothetical protein [Myxococcales bacterium]MCB9531232.1 hypothetical protein [Myxococcales bacterium]MCB9534309.1 hypothetical protein [Myxococcales bacterium]